MRVPVLSLIALAALAGTSLARGTKSHKEVALGMPYPGMQFTPMPLSQGAPAATATEVDRADERIDDAKILEITHAFNLGQIDEAKLAEANASDPRVKQLAAEILRGHQEADTRRALYVKRRHFSVMPSSTSKKLEGDYQRAIADLRGKTGADFDRAYLAAQIDAHRRDLDLLDSSLMRRASDDDVQMLLRELRPMLQRHLDQLYALQAELKR